MKRKRSSDRYYVIDHVIVGRIPYRVELRHGKTVFGNAEELTSRRSGAKKASVARIVLRGPDVVHFHKRAEETYIIENGEGMLHFDGIIYHVGPGDRIVIPPCVHHAARPHENSTQLVFLCISAPAFDSKDVFKTKIGQQW